VRIESDAAGVSRGGDEKAVAKRLDADWSVPLFFVAALLAMMFAYSPVQLEVKLGSCAAMLVAGGVFYVRVLRGDR
jgi:hypothetical protein